MSFARLSVMKRPKVPMLATDFPSALVVINILTCLALPCYAERTVPREVGVSIHINKIYNINTVDETYKVDAYFVAQWTDKQSAVEGGEPAVYENALVDVAIKQGLWVPNLEFINVFDGRNISSKRIIVKPSGNIFYNERFSATFSNAMDFVNFPFDTQRFVLRMEPFTHDNTQLKFVSAKVYPENLDDVLLGEWQLSEPAKIYFNDIHYSHISDNEHNTFSRLNVEITASRKATFYLAKLIFPLFLIISSSWLIFWLREFQSRVAISITLLLTVVAFNFHTSNLLPRLAYTTLIERLIIVCYISLLVTNILILADRIRRTNSIDGDRLIKHCRWLFPIGGLISMSVLLISAAHYG
jgi:Neurotransmitter-gated ion-channel ligand binding domain